MNKGNDFGNWEEPSEHHIAKRARRNKGCVITFDEKDRKEFVNGFHKRKQLRRKFAENQQKEKKRRIRLQERKERREALKEALAKGSENLGEDATAEGEGDDDEDEGELDKEGEPATVTYTTTTGSSVCVVTSGLEEREERDPDDELVAHLEEQLAKYGANVGTKKGPGGQKGGAAAAAGSKKKQEKKRQKPKKPPLYQKHGGYKAHPMKKGKAKH
eukprot:jgi/Mesvir1/24073/Mv10795-RA.1